MPPIAGDPAALIQQETASNHVVIFSLSDCAFSKKVELSPFNLYLANKATFIIILF
jgi:hypothetical protein